MDKMEFGTDSRGRDRRPAIAIIPLGTGNDLSRSLEWGGKYREKPLRKVVMDIAKVIGAAAYLAINSWKPRTILCTHLLTVLLVVWVPGLNTVDTQKASLNLGISGKARVFQGYLNFSKKPTIVRRRPLKGQQEI